MNESTPACADRRDHGHTEPHEHDVLTTVSATGTEEAAQ